jgi:hypothetical protein
MVDQIPCALLDDDVVMIEDEQDVIASLARSTDVRGVVAVEYDMVGEGR